MMPGESRAFLRTAYSITENSSVDKIFPTGPHKKWYIAGSILALAAVSASLYVKYYESDTDKRAQLEKGIKTAYETQIRADHFNEWYGTASGKVIRFALPEVISGDNSPYFEALVWSGGLERYKVYKDINKKWTDYPEINWKSLSDKTGVGIQ